MMEPREFWTLIDFSKAFEPIATTSLKIKQRDYQTVGEYPIIDQGINLIGGYFDNADNLVSGTPPFVVFGDHTKVIKFVDFKFIPGADGIKILKPLPMFVPKLFYYFLKQLPLPDKGYARHFQHLSKNKIPLPPLPEQRAIVAKLETLLSDLDNAVASLKQAKEQIKTYRQSVLKAAFTGKLTEEWRNENPYSNHYIDNLYSKLSKFNSAKKRQDVPRRLPMGKLDVLPIIPYGWTWQKSSDVCQSVRDGTHDTPKYVNEGYPLITSKNLIDGKLDITDIKYISEEDYSEIIKRSAVDNGDVLFGMIGTIGNPVVVSTDFKFGIKNVGLFKSNCEILYPDYLKYWLESSLCKTLMNDLKLISGTTQRFISLGSLRVLPVPLPSLEEQCIILQELDSRLTLSQEIDRTLDNNLNMTVALKQSLLKQAFEGKLLTEEEVEQTRQAPDWEPAEKLMERIKQTQLR